MIVETTLVRFLRHRVYVIRVLYVSRFNAFLSVSLFYFSPVHFVVYLCVFYAFLCKHVCLTCVFNKLMLNRTVSMLYHYAQ